MKLITQSFRYAVLVALSVFLTACFNQTVEPPAPRVVSISPTFVMEVKVAPDEATKFSDAFVHYAKTNTLNIDTLGEFPVHPAGEEQYMSFSYEIYNAKKEPAFVVNNPFHRGEISFVAYPNDSALVKQHVYDLALALVASMHGKVTSVTCDERVLDCDRLKTILK